MFDSIQSHPILSNYSPFTIIFMVIVSAISYKLLRFWYRTHLFTDLDAHLFNPQHHKADSETNELCSKYPNVWFPAILSSEVKPGQAKPVYIFEKDLVVFRTASGKIHVLDAYCAHQGAHLGVGGSVVGEDVQCPFHAWTFNGDGVCTSVPGLENSPLPKSKINTWKSVEMNHWVYVWYHAQDGEPTFIPPKFENLESMQLTEHSEFYLNCQIIDMFGNPFDLLHFDQLHSMSAIVSNDQVLNRGDKYHFMKNILRMDYQQFDKDKFDQQIAEKKWPSVLIKAAPVIFNKRMDYMEVQVVFTFCPTMMYSHWVSTYTKVQAFMTFAFLPVNPMKWHIYISFYHTPFSILSKFMAKIISAYTSINIITEFIVINNKKYLKRPYATKLDELQTKFVRWFVKSFY